MKEVIQTTKAPQAIGPYSQAIKMGDFLFASGQIAINPATGNLVEGGIEAQAEQVLENVKNILAAAGMDFGNVVKSTVFILNMDDFVTVNHIYEQYFTDNPPARSTVAVANLPKNALVEIEVIAHR